MYLTATNLDEHYVPPYFELGQIALSKGDVKLAWNYMDKARRIRGHDCDQNVCAPVCVHWKKRTAAEMFREVVNKVVVTLTRC